MKIFNGTPSDFLDWFNAGSTEKSEKIKGSQEISDDLKKIGKDINEAVEALSQTCQYYIRKKLKNRLSVLSEERDRLRAKLNASVLSKADNTSINDIKDDRFNPDTFGAHLALVQALKQRKVQNPSLPLTWEEWQKCTHNISLQELARNGVGRVATREFTRNEPGRRYDREGRPIDIPITEPARAGKRWSPAEEMSLRTTFLKGKGVEELARIHERSPGAIRSKLTTMCLLRVTISVRNGVPAYFRKDGSVF
jgi:hypothetical protein